MKYLLSIFTVVFIVGCGSSYTECKKLGYKGVVLYMGTTTPERKCSDGLLQGDYYITNDGLSGTRTHAYYKEVEQ